MDKDFSSNNTLGVPCLVFKTLMVAPCKFLPLDYLQLSHQKMMKTFSNDT